MQWAGRIRYARIAIVVQLFLFGIIAAELFDRRHAFTATQPSHRPRLPAPPPFPSGRLQAHVGHLDFNGTQLDEVLRILAQQSGENLGADWPALQRDIGVGPTDPVVLRLRNPTLAAALDEICRRVHSDDRYHAAYGEGGGGVVLLGTASSANDAGVPNLASVFDIHDLLGAPTKLQPLPQVPAYEWPPDVEAREDLRELGSALKSLLPDTLIISFGGRLIVSGGPRASHTAQLTLEAIRHPVPLRVETDTAEPVSGPLRIIMRREIADPLVEYWRKQFTPDVVFHTAAEPSESSDAPVIVSVSGATFHDLAGNAPGSGFPVVCIDAGEEGDFAQIRRARLEDGPRAYDVSSILSESQRWMAEPLDETQFNSNTGKVTTPLMQKQDALAHLIRENCDPYAWSFEPTESSPIAFWHGLLIVRQDPAVHRHLAAFLEHLQRTGQPVDPPPPQ